MSFVRGMLVISASLSIVAPTRAANSDFLFEIPDKKSATVVAEKINPFEAVDFIERKIRGADKKRFTQPFYDCVRTSEFRFANVFSRSEIGSYIDTSDLDASILSYMLTFRGNNVCDGKRNPRDFDFMVIIEWTKLQRVERNDYGSFNIECHSDYKCIYWKLVDPNYPATSWEQSKSLQWYKITDDSNRIMRAFSAIASSNEFPEDPF